MNGTIILAGCWVVWVCIMIVVAIKATDPTCHWEDGAPHLELFRANPKLWAKQPEAVDVIIHYYLYSNTKEEKALKILRLYPTLFELKVVDLLQQKAHLYTPSERQKLYEIYPHIRIMLT